MDPPGDVSDILVMGCAYTPHYGDEDTTLFKHDQMTDDFAQKVKGLPVYIEHDKSKQIGDVRDAYINENRQLMTLLHLYGDDYANSKLPHAFYKGPENNYRGFYNGLSLGNSVDFKIDHRDGYSIKEIVDNRPSEVSIVQEGDRPMTSIKDYWLVPNRESIDEYIKREVNPFIVRYF
jgi:hypothetical protein